MYKFRKLGDLDNNKFCKSCNNRMYQVLNEYNDLVAYKCAFCGKYE